MTPKAATAHDGPSTEEGDWIALQFFSPEDRALSPEEYAARHAGALGCFSFHLYRYREAAFGAWVGRVGEILTTGGEVERLRERLLTPEESAETRMREEEGL